MIVIESVLDFGEGIWGEDRLCTGTDCVCVIDGATPISRQKFKDFHSSAEWMAEQMRRYIAEHWNPDTQLPAICRKFVEATRAEICHSFPRRQDMPSLTIAALSRSGKVLRGSLLGDCSIYLLYKNGGVERITDQRTAHFYEKTLQAKREAEAIGADAEQAMKAQRIKNKSYMNQPNGFWTVSYAGDFEKEFRTFVCSAEELAAVLLCTDGFDRLFSRNALSPQVILTRQLSLKDAVRNLRRLEKEDPADAKRHDDVSAVLLTP